MKALTLAAALILCGGAVQAAQVFDGSGTGTGTSMNEITVLGEGHMVMHSVGAYGPLVTADADNPMSGLPGKCFGSIEMLRGSASGSGHCVFSKEGESSVVTDWIVTGMSAEGALTGTWSVIGASGAAAGLQGGGSFSNLTDRETGAFENTISGAVAMP